MKVRQMTAKDVVRVALILNMTGWTTFGPKTPLEYLQRIVPANPLLRLWRWLGAHLFSPHAKCKHLVVELEGQVVGFAYFVCWADPLKGCLGQIESVVTCKDHRGKGIATLMTSAIISLAKSMGVKRLLLAARDEVAKHTYVKAGFTLKPDGCYYLDLAA